MASILDKYGIKEVADVVFYEIDDNGNHGKPVLYLDTLKVSTIEQSAELAEARGGKGNPALIAWDYGKEITVTLEDALFSAKSMAIMFSGGANVNTDAIAITKTVVVTGGQPIPPTTMPDGTQIATPTGGTYYDEAGTSLGTSPTLTAGKKYFYKYSFTPDVTKTIDISANAFPGTYYITGDTYARSQITGKDEFFQFVLPKAKVQSENTITLEAEGDPSTFSMNLKVLRPDDGKMMRLIQYSIDGNIEGFTLTDGRIITIPTTTSQAVSIPFAYSGTISRLVYKIDGDTATAGTAHSTGITLNYDTEAKAVTITTSSTTAAAYKIEISATAQTTPSVEPAVNDYIILNVVSAS